MLLSALNQVGLNSLTYTPSGMNFLRSLLNRADYEVPYMVVAVGVGSDEYELPKIVRKSAKEIIEFL
jgi:uncharacterized protein (DUF111 family)